MQKEPNMSESRKPLPSGRGAVTEAEIKARIRLAVGREATDCRLFNNPVGDGWAGVVVRAERGMVTLGEPRRIRYGVGGAGGSDLIGLRSVLISPNMVGERVAVFAAVEVKRPGVSVPEHQVRFVEFIREMGGIAGVVRSPDEALRLLHTRD